MMLDNNRQRTRNYTKFNILYIYVSWVCYPMVLSEVSEWQYIEKSKNSEENDMSYMNALYHHVVAETEETA